MDRRTLNLEEARLLPLKDDYNIYAGKLLKIKISSSYKDLIKLALKRDKWTCQDCGKRLLSDNIYWGLVVGIKYKIDRWGGFAVHHIIPLSKGGENIISNLITLCDNCHRIRHNSEEKRQNQKVYKE